MNGSKKLSKWLLLVLLVLGYIAVDKLMFPDFAGSATLSWTAPTENEDDSPLTSLAGYNIHYGTHAGRYSNTIYVDNPDITSYTVENLPPGTYYFVVTASNNDGNKSILSNEVSKQIH